MQATDFSVEDTICIKVLLFDNSIVETLVKPSEKVYSLASDCKIRKFVPSFILGFSFSGKVIEQNQTFTEIGIKEGELIESGTNDENIST